MGVRGLETYMFKIKHGVTDVDIRKEIKSYREQNQNKNPIIVIDYLSFTGYWQSISEILCGLRANEFLIKARSFFQSLRDAGAELVFFADGLIQPEKSRVWLTRRNDAYNTYIGIFDAIENETSVYVMTVNEQLSLTISGNVMPYFDKVVREMGQCYTSYNVECDLDLAAYACKNNVFAILADDSDFLIYPGSWRYWSIKYMDQEELVTIQYNKSVLRSNLSLSEEQMPLFAALGSNDFVRFDLVKDFQSRLGHFKYKFKNIANFMRSCPTNLTDKCLRRLAINVCAKIGEQKELAQGIKDSIAFYDINNPSLEKSESNPFMQKLLNSEIGEFVYAVLRRSQFLCINGYDDMRRYGSTEATNRCYTKLVLDLHLRKVGILLNSQKAEGLKERVLAKLSHDTPYQEYFMDPEYPPSDIRIPPLDQLIFRTEGDLLDEDRFRLFQWIYCDTFNAEALFKLPKEYVPILATLCFLIKKWELTEDEADIFLIVCKDSIQNSVPENLKCQRVLNKRAFRILHMILQMQCYSYETLNLVGLNDFVQLLMFDGFHFQHLYKAWEKMDASEKILMQSSVNDLSFLYRESPLK